MYVKLTNREPIRVTRVPNCDKIAAKEKPRPVLPDRTRGMLSLTTYSEDG